MAEKSQVIYLQNKNFLSTLIATFVAILISVPLAVMVATSVISKASAQSVDPQSNNSQEHPINYVYPPCYDFGTQNNTEQNANPQINQSGGAGYGASSSDNNHTSDNNHDSQHKLAASNHPSSVTNNTTNNATTNITQTTNNSTTNTIKDSFNEHSYNGNEHSFNTDSYKINMDLSKTINHTESDIKVENETYNKYEGVVGSNITTDNQATNTLDTALTTTNN